MSFKVFVDGQEGTTGLRIFEYLSARADIEILRIDEDRRKDPEARRTLIDASDVTFLCLPDVASRQSVELVTNPHTCIIDASTAFRTDPNWAYGLPELGAAYRDAIRGKKRIAVPGCHASAFVLSVHPLVKAGIVPASYPVSAYSLTGYSGGGKKMIADYQSIPLSPALEGPRPYALELKHKHLPEMKAHGGLDAAPIFTPIVGNFLKGLAVTTYWHPRQFARKADVADIHACMRAHYADEHFINVRPIGAADNLDGGFFDVQACNDTNRVDLFTFGDEDRIVTIARLDNLGKGAAGAAIQCMNLHLGCAENQGLARD
ncbi:N-acetyl-gamma-glutamyl-phosphate reductase [Robbsia andropogonis]|uniref:N-acetyl-gamma-glutamyl-phosphate reductase n=1 Tax=Robbsia andropogonis TaxID=28092 RepID=A0A0F5K6Y6_9BURK|nr:N-acetyl-gamma-glutamyl-phosphate reductase [Robbsia andropogonis]KKB65297.1 N-acetyl-gamma-glutamyl-phosphate reductase [Robbsia andropogonis]MCP1117219.1 N-acetyl-gamma-glutamyl-phosphate reductase [Robbsia andropogonis]MCP1128565.1 N-acetyl-gamma-glutamyl-phosphate reductase [Robbsia andropogonis]